MKIKFKLIVDYPEREPPEFWFECAWLTEEHGALLERRLVELWRRAEGSVVLYLWHQDLANGGVQGRMIYWDCVRFFSLCHIRLATGLG